MDSLSLYWQAFPKLQDALFTPLREGFYSLAVNKDAIRDTIYSDTDFTRYADTVEVAFESWKVQVDGKLRTIGSTTKPKQLIAEIAEHILKKYEAVALVDKYDVYEVLLAYWGSVMADDVYLLVQDGYSAIREIEVFTKITTCKKKDGTEDKKTTETGWDGKLIPKHLVVELFFSAEQKVIDDTEMLIAAAQTELDEMLENAEEDSVIKDVLKENGSLDKAELKKAIRLDLVNEDDRKILKALSKLVVRVVGGTKTLKDLRIALDKKVREQYSKLTDNEMMGLLLECKWYRTLRSGVYALYTAVSHRITERVAELAERYEQTMPQLETEVAELESKVKSHLERMGFEW